MIDEKAQKLFYESQAEKIVNALEKIKEVKGITRGWPEHFEKLPCISVIECGNRPISYYSDYRYIIEFEHYVRIFSKSHEKNDEIAQKVDEILTDMGMELVFIYEDSSEIKQKIMRYKGIYSHNMRG